MPIKDKSGPNSAAYANSLRAARRAQRAMFEECGGFGEVPPLFGLRTILLCLIARYGRFVLNELTVVAPPGIVHGMQRTDNAGMIARWRLRRGFAVELNPLFPLYDETRDLLLQFGAHYRIELEADPPPVKSRRRVKRPIDLDSLFGSTRRTQLLAALELNDGSLKRRLLEESIPGVSRFNLKLPLGDLLRWGVLVRDGGEITFGDYPWTESLRSLLRAYLREKPLFRRSCAEWMPNLKAAKELGCYGLFGTRLTHRLLTTLAVHGPMPQPKLFGLAVNSEALALRHLLEDRIFVKQRLGDTLVMSLNADHPVYDALSAFLMATAKARPLPDRPADMRGGSDGCSVDHLFGTPVQRDILAAIAACQYGEIEATALRRLYPEHHYQSFWRRLTAMKGWKLLRKRAVGNMHLYRFNGRYPSYELLMRLMEAVLKMRPRYRILAPIESDLRPSNRVAMQRLVVATRPRGVITKTRKRKESVKPPAENSNSV
jgi:hypothetical protein